MIAIAHRKSLLNFESVFAVAELVRMCERATIYIHVRIQSDLPKECSQVENGRNDAH